jgi:predicted transcriptional regulator
MGHHSGVDVPVQYICDVLNVTQPEISSSLNTLMKRDVIVRSGRGVYRFRDPLFRQ